MLTGDDLLKKVQSLETHRSVVPVELAKFLSQEVCKDLDYNEIYKLAEEAMSLRFMRKNTIESLCEDYGERYDYVFLDNGIDPALCMINQSFVVKDFENGETYEFLFISENNWLIKRWGVEHEMTQKDVERHYKFFTSLWQDYDVTLLEPAQNTAPAS